MLTPRELTWEEVSSPDFGSRAAWRAAVAEIAAKAHEKLPECSGRIESAVKMVLAGDVKLLPDGAARVASQSNGTTQYHVVNGHCDCKDYTKAPHQFCKHRLSSAIARRAQSLLTAKGDTNGQAEASHQPALVQPDVPTVPLPEVPAIVSTTITVDGRRCELKLTDTDDNRLLQRLTRLLAQYPSDPPTSTPPATDIPQCPVHGPMKPSTKGKGYYCPHKRADGTWCKGK